MPPGAPGPPASPGGVLEEAPGHIAAAQDDRLRTFRAVCKLFFPFAHLTPADEATPPRILPSYPGSPPQTPTRSVGLTGPLPLAQWWSIRPRSSTKEGATMPQIQWETDFQKAVARAKAEDKPVLLDFFNPG
ncbi:MAG: hypothetical protein Kow0054_00060 [Deferrisoma sp.]